MTGSDAASRPGAPESPGEPRTEPDDRAAGNTLGRLGLRADDERGDTVPYGHQGGDAAARYSQQDGGAIPYGQQGSDARYGHQGGEGRPARAPRRFRRLIIALLALLGLTAVVVLIVVGPTAARVIQQRDTTVSAPDRVAGLTRDTGSAAAQNADYLKSALLADVPLDRPAAAVYTDSARRSVFFLGGTASTWSPQGELDALFAGVTDDNGGVTGVRGYDPGPLGGVLRCGTTATGDGQSLTVCGWADHGSAAVAVFGDRPPAEAARLLRDMRATMQHRG